LKYKVYVGFGSQLFHNYCENPRFNADIVKTECWINQICLSITNISHEPLLGPAYHCREINPMLKYGKV